MRYTAIRKDFRFDQKCPKCGKFLTTNTGYLLRDELGVEDYYGSRCAAVLTGSDLKHVPDLTKAQMSRDSTPDLLPDGPKRVGGAGPGGGGGSPLERALRYLLLRQQKLRHLPRVYYDKLQPMADRFADSGTLSDRDIAFVLKVEASNAVERRFLGLRNLQTVYAFDVAIERALVDVAENRQEFLKSNQTFLREHLYLTAGRVAGVRAWLAKIPRFREPDSSGFWR